MKSLKPKSCRHCKTLFVPYHSLKVCCSIPCEISYATMRHAQLKKRKERAVQAETNRSHREAKERIKTRSQWLAEAQTATNAWVRERDKGKPCVSCDKPDNGLHQRHASHWKSVGSNSALRFHPFNIHASCSKCNNWLSGNIANYAPRLVEKIGQSAVDWMDTQNQPYRWEIEDAKAVKLYYREQLKLLKDA